MNQFKKFFIAGVLIAFAVLLISAVSWAAHDEASENEVEENVILVPTDTDLSSTRTASPWFESLLMPDAKRQQMTGDWFGLREELAEHGVTISSGYVSDLLGNPVGGHRKGVRYNHSWGLDLNVDMEKLVGLKGLQLHTSGLWRYGRNLSKDKIGNTFTASEIYGSQEVKFYGLYLQQALFDDHLDVKFGRMTAGDDFASSPLYWLFINNAIDGNPISLPINLPFSTYPNATWGARIKVKNDIVYSTSGIYSGDTRVGRDSAHGLDFTMRFDRGLFLIQEFGVTPNHKPEAKGMPGNYKIGGFWSSGMAKDLYRDANGDSYTVTGLPQRERRGNYGFYAHIDQMVYREAPGSDEGLTPFVAATWSPDEYKNQFPFFIDGGVTYKGLLPHRKYDITMVGFAYGGWSTKLANSQRDDHNINGNPLHPQRYEAMFDFAYRIAITPWLFIQPNIQYIINPGGRGNNEDAMVIGAMMGVTF